MSSTVNGSSQAESAPARTLSEVEEELSQLAEAMSVLKSERDSVDAAVREATEAQEPWRLEELGRLGRDVRARIEATQARQWGLYAERAGLQLPEAEAQAAAAKEEYDRAHAEYLELYARVNRLGVESNNANVRALGLRQTMEENERKARAAGSRHQARQS
jgi:hypothetical protein